MNNIKTRKDKKYIFRKIFAFILILCVIGLFVFAYIQLDKEIPNNIKLTLDKNEEFDFSLPMEGIFDSNATGVLNINNQSVPAQDIKLNFKSPFTIKATELGNFKINIKLFGFLTFKQVDVEVVEKVELIPGGDSVGIYLETDGVMVLGTGVISGEDGLNYEPTLNKLNSGDYIVAINDQKIDNKEQVMDIISKSEGQELRIQVRRKDEYLSYNITPIKTASGDYKIGTWIRDDTQGIGTLTFVTPNGEFGALGHGITDVDTSIIVEIDSGTIYTADIMTIIKGKQGKPGELIGVINKENENKIGTITQNTSQGIFGTVNKNYKLNKKQSLPIGLKQEVHKGPATILSCVNNQVVEYDIMIEDVTLGGTNNNKGIVITIVDKDLLQKTGGIVQGMSGSPIIQDNKIIGAVTHVFIQDSTKGYGTFIENMIYNLND